MLADRVCNLLLNISSYPSRDASEKGVANARDWFPSLLDSRDC